MSLREGDVVQCGSGRGVVQHVGQGHAVVAMEDGTLEIFKEDGTYMEDKHFFPGYWVYSKLSGIFFKITKIVKKTNICTTMRMRWFSFEKGDMYVESQENVYRHEYGNWNPLSKVGTLCPRAKETTKERRSSMSSRS